MSTTQHTSPAALPAIMPRLPDFANRLPQSEAEAMYALAYQLTERGLHDKAFATLTVLRLYRPKDPSYAKAMAICCRKMGRYDEAVRYFAQTMELRPDDYEPAFQMIECMVLMGAREQAGEVLRMISVVARHAGLTDTLERAETLLGFMQASLQ